MVIHHFPLLEWDNFGSNDNSNLQQGVFLRNTSTKISKLRHLIIAERVSPVWFWPIQPLWFNGDASNAMLDAFQLDQVKVLSSSHQACSSLSKCIVSAFPPDTQYASLSSKANSCCCCCRHITDSALNVTLEQMHSVATAVISLTICFS